MTRLLLGPDLILYEDGTISGPPGATLPPPSPAELPYRDSRFVGRVLTVAADGSLTWVLNEHVPEVDATFAGMVLTINSKGSAEWRPVSTLIHNEVIASDGAGEGVAYYGPDVPETPARGDLHIVTRLREGTAEIPAPTDAPSLAVPTVDADGTVHLSWTAVADSEAYVVVVGGADIKSVTTVNTTLVFGENQTHAIKIYAVNGGGYGPFSNTRTITTPNVAPPPVLGLHVVSLAQGLFTVGWDFNPTVVPDFDVFVVTADSGTVTIDTPGNTATVTGAVDSFDVTVTVKVRDDGPLDSSVSSIIVRTPDAPGGAAPDPPTGLHTTRIGYSSADFAWTDSASGVFYEWSINNITWYTLASGVLSVSVTGLSEETNYTFRVRHVTGTTPSSVVALAFTTLPQIAGYIPGAFVTRSIGYPSGEDWSAGGLSHLSSGRYLSERDDWAGDTLWPKISDKNLTTVCEYPSTNVDQNQNRYIVFGLGFTFDDITAFTVWCKYPGLVRFHIWGVPGFGEGPAALGSVSSATADWTATLSSFAYDVVAGTRFMLEAAATGASPSSNGRFGVKELAATFVQATSATPIYNDP